MGGHDMGDEVMELMADKGEEGDSKAAAALSGLVSQTPRIPPALGIEGPPGTLSMGGSSDEG